MPTESSNGGHKAVCDYCGYLGTRRSTLAAAEKDYAEHVETESHKRRKASYLRSHKAKHGTRTGSEIKGRKLTKFRVSGTNGGNLRGGVLYANNVQEARSKWEKDNPGYRAVKIERQTEANKNTIRGM